MKRNFKPSVSSFLAMAAVLFFVACSKETDIPSDRNMEPKKAVHITDEAKLAMINSVKNLDGSGRLYMVDYTVDYTNWMRSLQQIARVSMGFSELYHNFFSTRFKQRLRM